MCRCNPPMEAYPGDEWMCPDCAQLYWADEAREWQEIPGRKQPETAELSLKPAQECG